jgi:hypothetical protein
VLWKDIFPLGVVNVVTDNNDLGDFLTRHPDIAKISFTGSTPSGRQVMEAAAATLKRLTLEVFRFRDGLRTRFTTTADVLPMPSMLPELVRPARNGGIPTSR